MFDSPLVDIAVGLSFLYFLLGLVGSAVNEMISGFLKNRSKHLKTAIIDFLQNDWGPVSEKIINSPYVKSLHKKNDSFPSYIPSKAFSQSLIDIVKAGEALPENIEDIRRKINNSEVIKGEARTWMLGMLDQAHGKVENFYTAIESSYDRAMERVSGWYKRQVQLRIFLIGIFIAVVFNVDSIEIAKTLWSDEATAKQLADLAERSLEQVHRYTTDSLEGFEIKNEEGEVVYSYAPDSTHTQMDNIRNVTAEINLLPIPIGWQVESCAALGADLKGTFGEWLSRLLGWLLTAIAVYLGAPFWFDLLNKVVDLRSTGKKPAASASPAKSKDD